MIIYSRATTFPCHPNSNQLMWENIVHARSAYFIQYDNPAFSND